MSQLVLDPQSAGTAMLDTVTRGVVRLLLRERMLRGQHHKGSLGRPHVGRDELGDARGEQDLQSTGCACAALTKPMQKHQQRA